MELKNKLIYIISVICSIYISYLICRVYTLGILGITVITLFISAIMTYVTYLYNRNISHEEINKKSIIIISVLAIFISIIVLKCNFNFFTKTFHETNVEIYSNNKDIEYEIIKNIKVNNTIYTINKNTVVNNGVTIENSDIKIGKTDQGSVKIDFPKSDNIIISFKSEEQEIFIKDGNNINNVIIEESKDNPTFEYEVTSNIEKDNFFVIRLIISLLLLTYVTILIISILLYNNCKENRYFIATLLISALGMWYYYNFYARGIYTNDTLSYIVYPFRKLLNLEIQGRTPIYPIIIRICEILFGKQYLQFLVIIQYIIWYIATIYFYKTLEMLIKNKKCIMIFTILYTLCPAIITWNNVILTESIALSGTVIFIHYIIKYIKKPNITSGAIAIVISFILTFHRPTAIIYVLFLEIFWVARFIFERENIKIDIKCFILSTISIIVVILYGIAFQRTFGFFSISDVVVRQDLYICIQEEYYMDSNNEQFKKDIEQGVKQNKDDIWKTIVEIQSKYNIVEIKKLTGYCKKQNIPQYIEYIEELAGEHGEVLFEGYTLFYDNEELQTSIRGIFAFVTFAHVYIVLFIELVLLIYKWVKNKRIPWIHCGLFGFPFVIVFSSFIGTCAEFMRTAICVLPFIYVSLAMYLNELFSIDKNQSIL